MTKFDYLKPYSHQEYSDTYINDKHIFIGVKSEDNSKLEAFLGYQLPKELKDFYIHIGYGFLCNSSKTSLFNRIMSPTCIYNFYNHVDEWEFDERPEEYTDTQMLVFFEVDENTCLTINTNEVLEDGKCPIYLDDTKIADSLEDFILKMEKDSKYYLS